MKFIGDAILVKFTDKNKAQKCSKELIDKNKEFKNLKTSFKTFSLSIKIVLASGIWKEFILGNEKRADIYLSGNIFRAIAEYENNTESDVIKDIGIITSTKYLQDKIKVNKLITPLSFLPMDLLSIASEISFGEHRPVSCLFIKVTGYEIENPDFDILDKFFLNLMEIVEKYQGFLQLTDNIQSEGCKIFILFGAPVSYGNDVFRAVQSGIEIMKIQDNFKSLSVAVSINSGYVFAGMIGDERRRKYTVIGDVVNTASRLADTLNSGEIVVSRDVYRLTSRYMEYEKIDSVNVKGKEHEVERYVPVEIKDRIIYEYSFIGRKEERDKIIRNLEKGNRFIYLKGEAGIGKTRLVDKIEKEIILKDFTIIRAKAESLKQAYGIFAEMIQKMTCIKDSDSGEEKKKKLQNYLNEFSGEIKGNLISVLPILGKMLFNIDYKESIYDQLSPEIRKENLLDGIRYFIETHTEPICVVIDDFHLSKNEDIEALNFLSRTLILLSKKKISFFISSRPDSRELTIDKKIDKIEIELEPLDEKCIEKLILNILGGNPLESNLYNLLLSRTSGNPLYIEQFLLYMIEKNLIVLKDDSWNRCSAYREDDLPESLFSIILARIDQLQEKIKQSIRLASVIGIEFREDIIEKIMERNVHLELQSAENEGIIDLKNRLELEYIFSHALIREVIYESILNENRKILHRHVGKIIEEIYKTNLKSYYSLLAFHFDRSNEFEKAIEYYIKAGIKAKREYRNDEAINYLERALYLLNLDNEKTIYTDILIDLSEIYTLIGQYEKSIEIIESLIDNKNTERLLKYGLMIKKCKILSSLGSWDESLKICNIIENNLNKNKKTEISLLFKVLCESAGIYRDKYQLDEVIKYTDKAMNILDVIKRDNIIYNKKVEAQLYSTQGAVYLLKYDYNKSSVFFKKAISISRENKDLQTLSTTYSNLGIVNHSRMDYKKALELYKKSYKLSKKTGYKKGITISCHNIGCIYNDISENEKALESYFIALNISQESNSKQDIVNILFNIGNTYNNMNIYDKAIQYNEEALEIALEMDDLHSLSRIYNIFGSVYKKKGDFELSKEYFIKSLDITEKLEDYTWVVEIIIKLVTLLLEFDKLDEISNLLRKGYKYTKKYNEYESLAELHLLNHKLCLIRNNIKSAEKYILLAEELSDKVIDNEKIKLLLDARVEFDKMKNGSK